MFAPPAQVTGIEDPASLTLLNAATAMRFNGDAATQVLALPPGAHFTGVETYFDEKDRSRLRLLTFG